MRRTDRTMPFDEALALLGQAQYGVLSTSDSEGHAYGIPLNFCVLGKSIAFHCATEGRKLANFSMGKKVSFCVVGRVQILPEKFACDYQSVIIEGTIEEVFGEDKGAVLNELVAKYSPNFLDEGHTYIEQHSASTRAFQIRIEHISGKSYRK